MSSSGVRARGTATRTLTGCSDDLRSRALPRGGPFSDCIGRGVSTGPFSSTDGGWPALGGTAGIAAIGDTATIVIAVCITGSTGANIVMLLPPTAARGLLCCHVLNTEGALWLNGACIANDGISAAVS